MQISEQGLQLLIVVGSISFLLLAAFALILIISFNLNLQKRKVSAFRELVESLEKERQRIAEDLHDEIAPLLSAAKITISSFKDEHPPGSLGNEALLRSIHLLDKAVVGIRESVYDIAPSTLSRFGLHTAINELCDRINDCGNIKASFSNTDSEHPFLKGSGSIHVYRIVSELIHNALKHSDAKNIHVVIKHNERDFDVLVEDDGKGFDIKTLKTQGIGLNSIQNRVKLLEGKLKINSEIGKGTSIQINLPI